jgi:GDP-4-dehydro-6-deoxy-D-mannose reductase
VPIEVFVDPSRVRPVDQPLLVADATKLRTATGWEPIHSIESTLADMLDDWRRAVRSAP